MLNVYVVPGHNTEITVNKYLFTDSTAMSIDMKP